MLIKKNIEVGIDVTNGIGLFSDDGNIMSILADRFENRCFRGCFITQVLRILRMGDADVNQFGEPDYVTIPVIFEVEAIVFAEGEIINNCVVLRKNVNNILVCKSPYANIFVNGGSVLESVVEGQTISVRAMRSRYNQGSADIKINAIPFLQSKKNVIFQVGKIENAKLFEDVLERIKAQEDEAELFKESDEKTYNFFVKALYAYKKPQEVPGIQLSIEEVARGEFRGAKYLVRDIRADLTQPICMGHHELPEMGQSIVKTEMTTDAVVLYLLEDYCSFLRTICEMMVIYSTSEIRDRHRNLWQIFKKNKIVAEQ